MLSFPVYINLSSTKELEEGLATHQFASISDSEAGS